MMLDIVKDVKVIKTVILPFDRLDVDTPVDAQVDVQVKHLETQVLLSCSAPVIRQVFQRD